MEVLRTELAVHLMRDRLVGSHDPASSFVGVNMDRLDEVAVLKRFA